MTDSQALKAIIKGSGIKMLSLAEKLGIGRTALWNKINNKSYFTVKEVYDLCLILGISGRQRESIFFCVKSKQNCLHGA